MFQCYDNTLIIISYVILTFPVVLFKSVTMRNNNDNRVGIKKLCSIYTLQKTSDKLKSSVIIKLSCKKTESEVSKHWYLNFIMQSKRDSQRHRAGLLL